MIVYGISQLWKNITSWIFYLIPDNMRDIVARLVDDVPQIMIAAVVIVIGLKLIAGKKEELNGEGK